MPQFQMEGSLEPDFQALDEFTQGYIEALFFTETEPGTTERVQSFGRVWNHETDSSLPGDVGFGEFAPDALAKIIADCKAYQEANAALLERAYQLTADGLAYSPERAGHDFWLTRNGHGAGFWSREFTNDDGESDRDIGDELAATCGHRGKAFGEVWATFGDDGKVYV